MKGSRRLRDKMKEIKLTDRSDITFNPLLIFSVLQLLGSSGDDQGPHSKKLHNKSTNAHLYKLGSYSTPTKESLYKIMPRSVQPPFVNHKST